jgi:3-hydroxyisobutyrate dehydrogenase-like beta-hydroxyacid dehydrogenase
MIRASLPKIARIGAALRARLIPRCRCPAVAMDPGTRRVKRAWFRGMHGEEDKTIGVIGLGLMGTALAARLLEHGYATTVWNRSPQKAEGLLAQGAVWSDHPLRTCHRLMISLYNTDAVEQVLEQMADDLRPGQILLDTTTGEPHRAAALGAKLAARGVRYLDAPISGSSEQTRRGEVTIMVGGDEEGWIACHDLWACLAEKVFHVGPCGSAAKMKLVSNLVLGLNRAALAEGLAFADAIGLDPKKALDVLLGSMAYSRIMDTKGLKMLQGDFRVQARLSQHLKDVRLILDLAGSGGMTLPLSEAHRGLLEECERAGYGDADNSAVIRAYGRESGSASPYSAREPGPVAEGESSDE